MFAYIEGRYTMDGELAAVLDCGGVGYALLVSEATRRKLPPKGERARLYTHLYLREDIMDLYGFYSEQERAQFRLLIGVSGVGPKVALSILSLFGASELASCVLSGDAKALTVCPGVGPKLAQRLLLELKDKMNLEDIVSGPTGGAQAAAPLSNQQEAISALLALGYSQSEALAALRGLDLAAMPLEEAIKIGLKQLMRETR